jgi:hypothetical protein
LQRANRSFVVPCCVFAKAAHNSAPTPCHDHSRCFVNIFATKAPDVIHIDELVMEGRNQVVWAIFD